jgi:hypothetical protein
MTTPKYLLGEKFEKIEELGINLYLYIINQVEKKDLNTKFIEFITAIFYNNDDNINKQI